MDASEAIRVAIVTEQFAPQGGGAERNVAEVARYLAERRHEVTILAGYCPAGAELPGVHVEQWGGKPTSAWRLLRFSRWAREQLQAGNYDASLAITAAVPATLVQPLAGIVPELHARAVAMRESTLRRFGKRLLLALNPKQQMLKMLERRTLADPALRCVVAISPYMAEQVRRHHPAAAERLAMVLNAVDLPVVDAGQRKRWHQEMRRQLAVAEQQTLFLFPAMDPQRKGLLPLLRACQRLACQRQDFVLAVAGPTKSAHQHLALRLGIDRHVRFLGPTSAMVPLWCAADVMVMPSFYDPASRVVIEAMRMGVPTISTVFDGSSAFMRREDGRVAGRILEDPGDADLLAAAMAEMCDPEQRRQAREATLGMTQALSMQRHSAELEALLLRFARTLKNLDA